MYIRSIPRCIHHICCHADSATKLKTFNSLILELQRQVPTEDPSVLDHINALLHNAVLSCKAAKATTATATTFETKEKINPGQKMELQWRFTKTTRSPGRKKKGQVFR